MTTTLQDPRVVAALDRMYAEATQQMSLLRNRQGELDYLASASSQERADALSAIYMRRCTVRPAMRRYGKLAQSGKCCPSRGIPPAGAREFELS